MIVEVVAFFESNSLALLAYASHMLRDVAVIVMSLFAIWLSGRGSSTAHTYGQRRADVLAATINALSLWLIAGLIFYNAFGRIDAIGEPHEHEEVEGVLVLIVGAIGLAVNIISAWVLHRTSQHNENVQGVFQHVIADMLTSVGVIISGILVTTLDWDAADHYISVIIGMGRRRPLYKRDNRNTHTCQLVASRNPGVPGAHGEYARAHRCVQTLQRH